MNSVAEEILSYMGSQAFSEEEFLAHYGMPRRSGRYPWGSGEEPFQHSGDFLSRVEEMRKSKFTYTDEDGVKWTGDNAIAKSLGYTSSDFRTVCAIANNERRAVKVAAAKALKEKGFNATEIGRQMGINESSVRSLLDEKAEERMNQARATADFLKEQVDKKKMIDVGSKANLELNVSKEKMDQALYMLQAEGGYEIWGNRFPQATNKGQLTTQKVLCVPGTPHSAIYDFGKVQTIGDYITRDDGKTFEKKFHYPESLNSKRLEICYAEDGGIKKDGLIELRRNVPDLSLGESRYSQVRIMVDGKKYIKGMAVYADDLPEGIDVRFNTNKSNKLSKLECLKDVKSDPDNPFGALIKEEGGQYWYTDSKGKKKLGLINKTREEGEWEEWKDSLPSQFLSKQNKVLAEKQLGIAKADKQSEFDDIMALNNPTIKKYYLDKFASSCDSAAVHLQAAALPGQKYHVILPLTTMSDREAYAPDYADGTKLALVRYPHGGTFEIPIVTVNNRNKEAIKMIGKSSTDAIGISANVAGRLSGADFDGDTVMCIPTHDRGGKVKITSTPELKDLEGFDPKLNYGGECRKDSDGKEHYYRNGREYRLMTKTDTEMGKISNLITDMTLIGATEDELARAVKHSMVVIDAEKHHLDYKQSELDNNIVALKKKYQGKAQGGAATIISQSKGEYDVDKRQGTPRTNLKRNEYKNNPEKGDIWYDPSRPEGALLYKKADDADYQITKVNKRTGEVTTITKTRQQKSTKMAETDDANTLVSTHRHPMELVYADYANAMKDMANKARIAIADTGKVAYSREAKSKYEGEVKSLLEKLNNAEKNAVRERAAQRIANANINEKLEANPDMKAKDKKKVSQQALSKARLEVGSVKRRDRNIVITDNEWEAIQAGAVSETILKRILNNSDPDSLRAKAMPKESSALSDVKIARIKAMSASYTIAQIADKLGYSTSTISKALKGGN
ncbi:MAG: helix-turn-helix domain-containing protein [Lachnospira eligens]|jgi:DNA-binding CsgD family transcriptional regulator|uniref:helix-turn-helix domain-containing protein n=1 Tax=Lachnospira eligens TaxID=39485 RepID=UPI003A47C290